MNLEKKALEFASIKHKGQFRKGKNHEDYIMHPIRVAKKVKLYKAKSHAINILVSVAYLHDTLEDTNTTYYELVENFGVQVATLVQELTTDKVLKEKIGKSEYLAIKMSHMTDWALTIKLCDRLDNIADILKTSNDFRNKYINETIYIINYLLNNRKISKTHIKIINTILLVLDQTITNLYDDTSKESIYINKLILLSEKNKAV